MRLSVIKQRSDRLARKNFSVEPVHSSLKRARNCTEPSTPEDAPVQKILRVASALPGSLIHLSQSADGKLRWIPPSSSLSSINNGESFSGCFSSDSGPLSTISPAFTEEAMIPASISLSLKSTASAQQESSILSLTSPSLESCHQGSDDCTASLGQTVEMVEDSAHQVTIGSRYQAPSLSEISFSSLHINVDEAVSRLRTSMRSSLPCGLSPYLSSKLKPGKHVLGAKRTQVFIRPGQLRHWAVGNSPSLASSLVKKGNACRNLAF